MNKTCARVDCGKTVYPIEELKCLDKTWHKQCFKCTECGRVLNMKNYKGYDKNPYCEPHYPQTRASVVVDTPENKRLAENTKNQSLIKYHEDFEREKGKASQISDDPEVQRHLRNTQLVSQAVYHHETERKETHDRLRGNLDDGQNGYPAQQQQSPDMPQQFESPYSAKMQQTSTLIYSSEQGGRVAPQTRQVGSIADYDPVRGNWGSSGRPQPSQTAYTPPSVQPYQQRVQPQQQQQAKARVVAPGQAVYRALYDYTARDTDEVSFLEGDIIVNAQMVEGGGWMTGTVRRTSKWGMLPANYVQICQ